MPQRRVAPYIAGGFCYSSPRQLRRGAGGLIPHGQGRGSEGSGPFPCPSPAPCWGRPWAFLCRAGSSFSSRVPWHPTPLPWEGCGPPLGWRGPFSAQGPFSPLTFPLTAFLRRFHPDREAVVQPKVRTPTLGPALLPPHGGRPGGQAPRQTRTCPSCQLGPVAPSARLVSRAWREGVGRRPAVAGDGPPPRGSMVPLRAERRAGLPGARAQRDTASEAQARVPGWTASPVSRSRADAGGAAVRQPSPASQGTVGVPTGGLAHTAAPGTSDCV